MCISCGCGKPNDRHGDDRNITHQDLEDAASAANLSVDQVVSNISKGQQKGAATAG